MIGSQIIIVILGTIFNQALSQYFRLPTVVKPTHYDLAIMTNLSDDHDFGYYGTVSITVLANTNTKTITLHSSGLQIIERQLEVVDLKNKLLMKVNDVKYKTKHDFLIIDLVNDIIKDSEYKIKLSFYGNVTEGLFGFYRSNYNNDQGKEEWLLITQFEPNYARSAFPCFDEPGFKATFAIQIGRHHSYTTASNMPLKEIKSAVGRKLWFWDQYEISPPMSTYLVAFMVSKLTHKSVVNDNITIGVWAKNTSIDQVDYALFIAPRILKFYTQNYFGVPYPLAKLDMVAVPDFYTPAMGNWGLMTFRESTLLYKAFETSNSAKYIITKTVAHKIANQWYGNYITMEWWTELWLNEGFASFVANFGIDRLDDEYDYFFEEFVTILTNSFQTDALTTSHPLSGTTQIQNDITTFLDSTTYEKGPIIVHMLETILGEKVFRRGVKRFLKTYKYSNVKQDDLWEVMSAVAQGEEDIPIRNYSIKEVMDTWTKQRGYPVITVNRDYSSNTATTVQVSQEPFQKLPDLNSNSNRRWWVPLLYTTEIYIKSGKSVEMQWLKPDISTSLTIPIAPTQWILFNHNITGYYRVNYDESNWDMLSKALFRKHFDDIPVLNRYLLVIDSLDLSWAGKLSYNVTLRLLKYISAEDENNPWIGFLSGIDEIDTIVRKLPSYDLLIKYMQQIFSDVRYTSHILDLSVTTRWFCKVNADACDTNSINVFNRFMNTSNKTYNTEEVPVNGRDVIYCTAIAKGNDTEWQFMWKYFTNIKLQHEKLVVIKALGCSVSEWTLQRYLQWSILPENDVKVDESHLMFESVASNPVGYNIALEFLVDDIILISHFHKNTPDYLGFYLKSVLEYLKTDAELEQIRLFIGRNKDRFAGLTNVINQAMDVAISRLNWIKTQYPKFIEALKSVTSVAKK